MGHIKVPDYQRNSALQPGVVPYNQHETTPPQAGRLRISGNRVKVCPKIKALYGDPGAIRTRDTQIRNLVLYPAELRDHARLSSLIAI